MGRCILRSPASQCSSLALLTAGHCSVLRHVELLCLYGSVLLHTQGEFPALVGLLAFCITRGITTASLASWRCMCGLEE